MRIILCFLAPFLPVRPIYGRTCGPQTAMTSRLSERQSLWTTGDLRERDVTHPAGPRPSLISVTPDHAQQGLNMK